MHHVLQALINGFFFGGAPLLEAANVAQNFGGVLLWKESTQGADVHGVVLNFWVNHPQGKKKSDQGSF